MVFSGRQCGRVGRTEEVLLTFKIFLVIICLHVVLVTSLEEDTDNSSLSPPPAKLSVVSFAPSSSGTPEVETTSLNDVTLSLPPLNKTEKTKITIVKTFNASGVKLQRNICNLSSICNDSAFFRGEIMFQYDRESTIPQNQHITNGTLTGVLSLSELKRSELNKTLQTLSETYFIMCATAEAQSTLNCTFTIKLNNTMNACAVIAALERVKIRPMEHCCCSVRTPCPSSPEELEKLQCDLQDPIVCLADHPRGPPFSSSQSIPVVPQATVLSQVPSATSFAEPPDYSPVTHNVLSTIGEIHPLSPQPSAPIASSPAIDMPPQSEMISSPMPQTHVSGTPPPVKASFSSPTVSAPANVITTSAPPVQTDVINTSSISDLENQVSQMEKALSFGSLEPNLAGEMINQVSKLLHSPPDMLAPLAQRLLKVVDDIGLQLNFSNKTISLTSPSLALAVIRVNASSFNTTTFVAQDPANLQVSLETQAPENSIGTITLPSSLMKNLPANDMELASRVQFNFFETPALFQDPSLENLSLISYVISSSVANLTVRNLTRNVTVTLKHVNPSQDELTVRCVFWDLGRNGGRGGWSDDGCSVKDRRLNETICTCSHLTSFGILLDLSRTSVLPAQTMALTFITYIGCGLSSIFLSVTLVTYVAFEKIRRDYPSKILIQLCAALLLLNLVFLLDSWIALYKMQGICISVAVFLHYFLLVSFTWMGLEAFHMYLALVKVFNTYIRKYILKFCIVGWGMYKLASAPRWLGAGSQAPEVSLGHLSGPSPFFFRAGSRYSSSARRRRRGQGRDYNLDPQRGAQAAAVGGPLSPASGGIGTRLGGLLTTTQGSQLVPRPEPGSPRLPRAASFFVSPPEAATLRVPLCGGGGAGDVGGAVGGVVPGRGAGPPPYLCPSGLQRFHSAAGAGAGPEGGSKAPRWPRRKGLFLWPRLWLAAGWGEKGLREATWFPPVADFAALSRAAPFSFPLRPLLGAFRSAAGAEPGAGLSAAWAGYPAAGVGGRLLPARRTTTRPPGRKRGSAGASSPHARNPVSRRSLERREPSRPGRGGTFVAPAPVPASAPPHRAKLWLACFPTRLRG
ncbi:adhesion G-protein coupled receptor G2 [Piliocolobus tephrosceles]|uniref:adhesion G-protein coupled receptor G2 n=1 Tax=Piliocolobus tephrosceles TaxID=591936 RepID=UPI000E6AE82C|nr:adhesion G-protein coupled receptor G2 [Piliocolobus tephrosceles]